LISSAARVIALAASQPYKKAVARGAPITIGFSAAIALDPKTSKKAAANKHKNVLLIPVPPLK
jgi:hypothetical protein